MADYKDNPATEKQEAFMGLMADRLKLPHDEPPFDLTIKQADRWIKEHLTAYNAWACKAMGFLADCANGTIPDNHWAK